MREPITKKGLVILLIATIIAQAVIAELLVLIFGA